MQGDQPREESYKKVREVERIAITRKFGQKMGKGDVQREI
jgi:hypothetical protein